MATVLIRFMELVYSILVIFLIFVLFINFLSFISSCFPTKGCHVKDGTCICISPYRSQQANKIFTKFPVTYRSTLEKQKGHIQDWANQNLNWYQIKEQGNHTEYYELRGIRIRFLLFTDDFRVYARRCKENRNFVSVAVHAQARTGVKNFNNELDNTVQDLYSYLYRMNRETEQVYHYCLTKEEMKPFVDDFS
eukprot:TRINITY_DN13027_c0_g1_i1.p2 TRINITY_DN13027_c0_g1~~TRINITY_DN13027_c0_g1_i1.p2  ORF type:complete len:193 (-),score=55.47 TRINITY_DN13027_c0_g1_i1:126-704(-)